MPDREQPVSTSCWSASSGEWFSEPGYMWTKAGEGGEQYGVRNRKAYSVSLA